ncbi:MAG: efflux RND transporter periplasmic adaptor subunit [Planctomycetes bacterium]|nr:efflux RND transporter periplasmic adaptor subunit [Planctomycetota bacterium]MBI3835747.1 efflux RND transporter periplasmic adaptor subunit [Planctomycetota bacterium]
MKDSLNAAHAAQPNEAERSSRVTLDPDAVRHYGIKIETARRLVLIPTIVAPARVAFNAERVSHVGSLVGGRVRELRIRQGDFVKKGDALIVLDSQEVGEAQNDFLQKSTTLNVTNSALELAKIAYERDKNLYDQSNVISLSEVQRLEGVFKTAEGNWHMAEVAASTAENKLHLMGMDQQVIKVLEQSHEVNPKFTLVASIDGQVTQLNVANGGLVRPERESIVTLVDMSVLWVLADVPEPKLVNILPGAAARVRIGSSTIAVEGTVSYISPEIDSATRSAHVRIEVKNVDGRLRAGAFAQAEIAAPRPGEQGMAVLAVPDDAIQTIDNTPVVFVPVDAEEHSFTKRAVVIGSPVGGMVPVSSGLKEGEAYVAAGSFILKADLAKSTLVD